MKKLLAALLLLPLLASCSKFVPAVHAQSATPGTVTVSWTPPTTNTDQSPITGTLTYAVWEVNPNSQQTPVPLNAVAQNVAGNSAQIGGVTDGLHCYAVQTIEVFLTGANGSSALSAVACTTVTGSTTPTPSPNAPTNVKAGP